MTKRLLIPALLLVACSKEIKKTNMETKLDRNLHHFNFRTAFMSGMYEGEFTMEQLLQKGDFGLGTFNNLEGEMIVLGGKIYRATADGNASEVNNPAVKTPSAMVTFFRPGREVDMINLTREKLEEWIDKNLDIQKRMYAIRITGSFDSLKTRSQHPVYEKPFPGINDIIDNMVYHNREETQGTLVGFQLPPYLEGINYPGLHFHFISDTGSGSASVGGCAPGFHIQKAKLSIMELTSFSVDVPRNQDFYELKLDREKSKHM